MTVHKHPPKAALRELIKAVERHELSSAELPGYLAGLSADGEILELAHQLAPLELPSQELLARLRSIESTP
jgi:hypothetical protein